ncbi:MAG TPA: P63C domain-containing protein [Chitinophagaceae bacterium]|nr:P63C domain-containing protein [Chitinophagaceae bacterium]
MSKKNLKVWGKGPFRIMDAEIDCYILEDGTPILNKGKMMKAIGRQWKGASRTGNPNFIGAVNLQKFIRPELEEKLKGIDFYDGGRLISGYHADTLAEVCNVYLEARQAGILTKSQLPIAQICEVLLRSFAKVGIRALIYEQLGFEKFKNPEAFRILIESYLSEEIRKWSKEFPDELFWQMDRIYGNQKTTSRNRPMYYAKFLRKYIYEPIEKGVVLKKLDEKIPRDKMGRKKARLHSATSEEIGLPAIKAQIWQVVATLKVSSDKRRFEGNFARMMGQTWQGDLFE